MDISANEEPGFFASLERRYHIVHVLAVAALAAATIAAFLAWFLPRPAFGPDLSLSGSVPASTTVTVTALPAASTLVLDPDTTVTDLSVGNIYERSNSPTGYTISVRSGNLFTGSRCSVGTAPCLWSAAADAGDDLQFTLKRDTVAMDFTSGHTVQWYTQATKNKPGTTRVAKVSYATGSTLRTAGAYSETITFTIATN